MVLRASDKTKHLHFLRSLLRHLLPTDLVDGFVERLKEAGTVSFVERRRASCNLTQLPQLTEQVASCKRRADIIVREWFPRVPKHIGTSCNAPGCERDVRRDNDVIPLQMFDNSVIGCVYALVKNPHGYLDSIRDPHQCPCYQSDAQFVAMSHSIHFRFHRTGVRIDENVQQ